MSSRHMDQRFDSSGSSYTSNCNLELASAGLGRTPKLLSGIDRPSPCALMYASFAVQQLKNDAITSEGGCDRNHCTSGSEKKRSANSITFVSLRIRSRSTPTRRFRLIAKTVAPLVCDRLKRRSESAASSGFPFAAV